MPDAAHNQLSNNYKLKDAVLDDIVQLTRWAPIIDICCSVDGLNALAPLFYDASADALQQTDFLQGRDLICNPPFSRMPEFIALIENAYHLDLTTRCILVAPWRPHTTWCENLLCNPLFRLLEIYPIGFPIFSGTHGRRPLTRTSYSQNCEPILIFEVNATPMHHRHLALADVVHPDRPIVAELVRLRYLRD